jgi:AraC-like DNA-binding protein
MPKTQEHDEESAEPLYHFIHKALNTTPLPQSVEELCTYLNTNRHQLWRACEATLASTPMTCLDFIRAQYLLTALSKNPTVKLMRLRRDLGLTSEDGFRRFCQRTFGLLPRDIKANPEQAAHAFEIRFASLTNALNRLGANQLDKPSVVVSTKTDTQNRHTKPTHKTDTQNRHTKPTHKVVGKKHDRK